MPQTHFLCHCPVLKPISAATASWMCLLQNYNLSFFFSLSYFKKKFIVALLFLTTTHPSVVFRVALHYIHIHAGWRKDSARAAVTFSSKWSSLKQRMWVFPPLFRLWLKRGFHFCLQRITHPAELMELALVRVIKHAVGDVAQAKRIERKPACQTFCYAVLESPGN